jgi:hypothetical protein
MSPRSSPVRGSSGEARHHDQLVELQLDQASDAGWPRVQQRDTLPLGSQPVLFCYLRHAVEVDPVPPVSPRGGTAQCSVTVPSQHRDTSVTQRFRIDTHHVEVRELAIEDAT